MALIQCKECGKEFSNESKKCVHCGSTKHRSFVNRHPIITLFGFIFVVGNIATAVIGNGNSTNASTTSTQASSKAEPKKNDGSDIRMAIENVSFKYDWEAGGFGSVMVMDLTIKNNNPYPVKDFTISCRLSAQSGTNVGTVEKKLLKRIEANGEILEKRFNVGFMNSQAEKAGCYISDLTTEPK